MYEISALIFAFFTGYLSVRYEGKIISRVAVIMLLTAAGGSLFGTLVGAGKPEYPSVLSLIALVVGHIGSEKFSRRFLLSSQSEDKE